MKKQRIVITNDAMEINSWIDEGWSVVSVTPQYIGGAFSYVAEGAFCFLIEK